MSTGKNLNRKLSEKLNEGEKQWPIPMERGKIKKKKKNTSKRQSVVGNISD